jgi:Kyanoviridae DNA helicase
MVIKPDTIYIGKKDDVYLLARAEASLMYEMQEFFTFEVPGARFTPAFKNKMWDGRIRLLNVYSGELYLGLLPHLRTFAEQREYKIEWIDGDFSKPNEISAAEVADFMALLHIHTGSQPIQPRCYQLDAIHKALVYRRTLLLSPTASGKSLIIYGLLRWYATLNTGKKALIIVPTKSLVAQMVSDFADYSSEVNWDAEKNVHAICEGAIKSTEKPIVVSTWQSIYKQPKKWFDQFGMVIGDEAHNFQSKSLASIMTKLVDCPYRIGTTGTLQDTKTHKLVLEGLFGPVYRVTSTRELMDAGQVAELAIDCILLKYDETTRKSLRRATYQQEIEFLVHNEKRNRFIRDLALSLKGNTLLLFNYVNSERNPHGKILHEMICAASGDRKVFFVHGGVDTVDRELIRQIISREDNVIVCASYGVFSTGVNAPNLRNVIFASPSKSKIRNLQSIGRGLRLSKGKTRARLFDIGDDLSIKTHQNHTLKHFTYRIELYNQERFEYKTLSFKL